MRELKSPWGLQKVKTKGQTVWNAVPPTTSCHCRHRRFFLHREHFPPGKCPPTFKSGKATFFREKISIGNFLIKIFWFGRKEGEKNHQSEFSTGEFRLFIFHGENKKVIECFRGHNDFLIRKIPFGVNFFIRVDSGSGSPDPPHPSSHFLPHPTWIIHQSTFRSDLCFNFFPWRIKKKVHSPESKVISLIMNQRAAKNNCRRTKRPTRWWSLILTFLELSNILSSMYEYVMGSPGKCLPPTLNWILASANT